MAVINHSIGMDIGGTNTVMGIVSHEGKVVARDAVKTKDYPILEDYVEAVSQKIEALLCDCSLTGGDVRGLGIGAPNADCYRGTIEHAPNLPWQGEGLPLGDMFSRRLGIVVKMTNDANAAAMGEMQYGVARGMRHFIMITLGTGVGSGIVVDGQLLLGKDGFAGELGHVIVKENGRECGCGRRGCLEAYCSATGVVRTARELLLATDTPSLLRDVRGERLSSKDVYDAAMKGDALANDIFRQTFELLGKTLADFVAFSNPEAIILFGGLAKAGELVRKITYDAMEARLMPIFRGKTKVLLSEMKDADAALLGASALV